MQELSLKEVDDVSGGGSIIALLALGLAIIVNSDKLGEFANGVIDGYHGV